MFTMNETCQQTPTTHHGNTAGAHNQTHGTHVRVKKQHDVFSLTCDKGGCNCEAAHPTPPPSLFSNTLVFTTADKHAMSKHFMTPLGPLQLTAEECNEILMKRAAAASNQANVNNVVTSQTDSASHFGHVLTHVNTTQIETKVKQQQDMGSQVRVPKERPYSCSECGKSFLLKHHLTTHARVHTGERPHVCVHCGKSFAHKHCLHTHLLLHSADRPYQCRECKKSFTLKHHLVTHTRVHTRDRPFICQECGRAFPLKRHLVTHSKFHSGERPFVCEECGESFSQKDRSPHNAFALPWQSTSIRLSRLRSDLPEKVWTSESWPSTWQSSTFVYCLRKRISAEENTIGAHAFTHRRDSIRLHCLRRSIPQENRPGYPF